MRAYESAEPLDESLRSFLAEEWAKIARVTGQPFSSAALQREDWIYDTGPADQAVVAARTIDSDRTLEFFARVQHGFYAEGLDVTDRGVLVDIAVEFGFDRGEFERTFDESHQATLLDFAETRSWGVMGYPTLLFRDGQDLIRVTAGYVPFDTLQPQLQSWMESRYGEEAAAGMICGPDEIC